MAGEPCRDLTLERNVFADSGPAVYSFQNWSDDRFAAADRNLFFDPDGSYLVDGVPGVTDLDGWRSHPAGHDRASLTADPRFMDARHGDFRLRHDSPAWALGIEPIDLAAIGLQPGHPFEDPDDPVGGGDRGGRRRPCFRASRRRRNGAVPPDGPQRTRIRPRSRVRWRCSGAAARRAWRRWPSAARSRPTHPACRGSARRRVAAAGYSRAARTSWCPDHRPTGLAKRKGAASRPRPGCRIDRQANYLRYSRVACFSHSRPPLA